MNYFSWITVQNFGVSKIKKKRLKTVTVKTFLFLINVVLMNFLFMKDF